jgi:hypothetical protein
VVCLQHLAVLSNAGDMGVAAGIDEVVVEEGRAVVAVSRVVDVDVALWFAVGMVNKWHHFLFGSTNMTNGPCAASQYIKPCFSFSFSRAHPFCFSYYYF